MTKCNDLTPKQARFVEEYLTDLNGTQAAIRAGYSEKTAMQQSYQLLEKTLVAAAIKKKMDKRSERTEITADRVLEGIAEIAFAGFSEDVNATHKLRGLELLGKHLAMFTERHVVEDNRPLKDDSREEIEKRVRERLERLGMIENPTIN